MNIDGIQTSTSLATLICLPSIMLGFGASSLAVGVLISSVFIFLLSLQGSVDSLFKVNKDFIYFFFLFLIIFAIGNLRGELQLKSYASLFALCFIIFSSCQFSRKKIFTKSISRHLILYFYFLFLIAALVSVLTSYKFGYFIYGADRAVFPFKEPSHFSLAIGPFMIASVVVERSILRKFIYFSFGVIAAVTIQSATLFSYIFITILVLFRFKLLSFLTFGTLIVFFLLFIFNDPYYSSRILIFNSSENLTALVYLQGLQDAYNSLVNTSGLGLGFQMLGSQPPSQAHYLILNLLGESYGAGLNRMDGGFLAAKIVAEFGIIGVILLFFYLIIVFRSYLFLRSKVYVLNNSDTCAIFFMSTILASSVEFFVRGMGYFSPSLFLFYAGVFFYFRWSRTLLRYD